MPTKNNDDIVLTVDDVEVISTVPETTSDDFVDMVNGLTRVGIAAREAGIQLKMAMSVFTRLAHVITGIEKHMKETCPNRRVVHLAYHARKLRTRKKNYRRMIRICEKEKIDEREETNNI